MSRPSGPARLAAVAAPQAVLMMGGNVRRRFTAAARKPRPGRMSGSGCSLVVGSSPLFVSAGLLARQALELGPDLLAREPGD